MDVVTFVDIINKYPNLREFVREFISNEYEEINEIKVIVKKKALSRFYGGEVEIKTLGYRTHSFVKEEDIRALEHSNCVGIDLYNHRDMIIDLLTMSDL